MGTQKFREILSPGLKFLRNASWGEEGLELVLFVWVAIEEWELKRCNCGEGLMVRYTGSLE